MHTVTDFNPGDKVKYIPWHAKGDTQHPEVEEGVVKRVSEKWVFVWYYKNGVLQDTAVPTYPSDLTKMGV